MPRPRKDLDLDNLRITIRKTTPILYDSSAGIFINGTRATLYITEQLDYYDYYMIAVVMNHEFIHWIIDRFTGACGYDDYLEESHLYFSDKLAEEWL